MLTRKLVNYKPRAKSAVRKVPVRPRPKGAAGKVVGHHKKRSNKRRAKRLKRGTKFSPKELVQHLLQFNNTCVYCQQQQPPLQKDHLIPLSRGGFHSLYNIVLACRRCNLSKGSREALTWYEEQVFYCAAYAVDLGLLSLVVRQQHNRELGQLPLKLA